MSRCQSKTLRRAARIKRLGRGRKRATRLGRRSTPAAKTSTRARAGIDSTQADRAATSPGGSLPPSPGGAINTPPGSRTCNPTTRSPMQNHYRHRRPRPITVGSKVGVSLALLWLSLAAVSGGWATAAVLSIICVLGGRIGDQVGNAYQDAESR